MRWSFAPGFDASSRAALDTGKPFVYACPPAVWMVGPLFARLVPSEDPGCQTVALAPDGALAQELALHLNADRHTRDEGNRATGALAASGLARDTVALRANAASTLVATPTDTLSLLQRSAFKSEQIVHAVLLWPEQWSPNDREAAGVLLGDMRAAQRVIVTDDPSATAELLERYARRAPTMRPVPWPDSPLPGVRVAISTLSRLPVAVAAVLDALAPRTALLWDPYPVARARWLAFETDPTVNLITDEAPTTAADAIIATDLPSPELLRAFQALTSRVVVLARPGQQAALARLAAPNRIMAMTREADQAHHVTHTLRTELRTVLDTADLTGELLQLAPLFDEYDPAVVGAALLRRGASVPDTRYPSWVRIKLGVGKRDRIKPGDIVGALINAANTPRDHVGLVELRDMWSIVEVRTESAHTAVRALKDIALRGRAANPEVETK